MQPVFLCYSQDFTDEDEVKEWIIKNALGTRNLTEMQFTELIGRLQNMRKTRRGAQTGNKNASKQKSKNATFVSNDTAEQVAKEIGVNRSTVFHAANFVDGLDAAEAVVPGFKDAVLTGEVKAQKQEVAAMRKQTPEEIKNNSRLFLFLVFLRVFLRLSVLSVTLPVSDRILIQAPHSTINISHAPEARPLSERERIRGAAHHRSRSLYLDPLHHQAQRPAYQHSTLTDGAGTYHQRRGVYVPLPLFQSPYAMR